MTEAYARVTKLLDEADAQRKAAGLKPFTADERIEREKEVAEQVTEYNDFLASQKAVMDANIDEVGRVWFNHFKRHKDRWGFGRSRVPSIRTFLRKLTLTEVLEAVEIAHERLAVYKNEDDKTFRYFCGVCWKLIRAKESGE